MAWQILIMAAMGFYQTVKIIHVSYGCMPLRVNSLV